MAMRGALPKGGKGASKVGPTPEAGQAVPKGVEPAPFPWKWPKPKRKKVLGGLMDASFAEWGNDIPRMQTNSGAATKSYLTEVSLLAALCLTVAVGFMQSAPPFRKNSIAEIASSTADDQDIFIEIYFALWTLVTALLMFATFNGVFMLVILSKLEADDEDTDEMAMAYLLVRVGKVAKLPLQLFVGSIALGVPALYAWAAIAVHWITAAILISVCTTALVGQALTFFVPLVGALDDTLEAERDGTLNAQLTLYAESKGLPVIHPSSTAAEGE